MQSPRARAAASAATVSPQKPRRSSDGSHVSPRDPEQAPAPVPFEDNLHFCSVCLHRCPDFHFRWQIARILLTIMGISLLQPR